MILNSNIRFITKASNCHTALLSLYFIKECRLALNSVSQKAQMQMVDFRDLTLHKFMSLIRRIPLRNLLAVNINHLKRSLEWRCSLIQMKELIMETLCQFEIHFLTIIVILCKIIFNPQ